MTLEDMVVEPELPEFLCLDTNTPLSARPTRSMGRTTVRGDVPGEMGLWVFILGDMTVFGAIFIVLMWEKRPAQTIFSQSAHELHRSIGLANTLVLLVSSYLVVAATWAHRRGEHARGSRFVIGALVCALAFAALKTVEYVLVIADGHIATTNLFFTFYFVLTGIHLLHVIVGSGLLTSWTVAMRRRRPWGGGQRLFEGIAVYWHMVDLLWIAIFTVAYIVCAA